MMYVLLTDSKDRTALVACEDQAAAEAVGSAAVYSDGGVSAWLVPGRATADVVRVIALLADGADCEGLAADPFLGYTTVEVAP